MAQNLEDGRADALKALVSTLAPQDAEKMSNEQVDIVAARLDQILGSIEAEDEHRNEKGQVLNEEGLPMIEISEPVDNGGLRQVDELAQDELQVAEPPDVIPLSSLSSGDRARALQRYNRMFDILEEEEANELSLEAKQQEQAREAELAKLEAEANAEKERKLAQREMQKKMGKALLRNIAQAREKEERDKAEMISSPIAGPSSCPTSPGGVRKPKKKVSFANLPDVDEDKPKLEQERSHITLGDVSIGILKGNSDRVRLKKDELANLPMKLEVVERVAGRGVSSAPASSPLAAMEEKDSDDESSPEEDFEHKHGVDHASEEEEDDDDDVWRLYEEGDEDDNEYDTEILSQAQHQREIALDYFKKRDTIKAELDEFASSDHKGEHEWDAPEVPLEATLASRPPKSKASRFKVSLQGSGMSPSQSTILSKAVRAGTLRPDGQLSGGTDGDSDSEAVDGQHTQRSLDMLMRGEINTEVPQEGSSTQRRGNNEMHTEPAPRPQSKFASRRQFADDVSNSSYAPGKRFSDPTSHQALPLRKPPTVMSTMKTKSVGSAKDSTSSVNPPVNPSFSSMILDSPSFPAPGAFSSVILDSPSFPHPAPQTSRSLQRPVPLSDQVRETSSKQTQATSVDSHKPSEKISRFKAART